MSDIVAPSRGRGNPLPGFSALRRVDGKLVRHSVVRRSFGTSGAYLVGHGLNFALMLAANRILGPGAFGLFYTAVLAITVMFGPIGAFLLVVGRNFASVNARSGSAPVAAWSHWAVRLLLRRGVVVAVVIGGVCAVAGVRLGIESWSIMVMIPVVVVLFAMLEVQRVAFQGILLFSVSSAIWIVSQAGQFALCVAGLAATGRVWGGLLGIGAAVAATVACFAGRLRRAAADVRPPRLVHRWRTELPFVFGYFLFVGFSNIDILVGYWLLTRTGLDAYSASALLPKTIMTATLPVAQVVMPVIVGQRAEGASIRGSVLKAFLLVLVLGGLATAALAVVLPLVEGSRLAVQHLDMRTALTLAAAATALGAVRVIVVTELALGKFSKAMIQLGAIATFVVAAALGDPSGTTLAMDYATVCWVLLGVIVAALLVEQRLRREG